MYKAGKTTACSTIYSDGKHDIVGATFLDSAIARTIRQMVPVKRSSRHWMYLQRWLATQCMIA